MIHCFTRALSCIGSGAILLSSPALGGEPEPKSHLDPARVSVQVLSWSPPAEGPWHAALDLGGTPIVLELAPASVRKETFQLFESREGGPVAVVPPPVTTHRGGIAGEPSSLAAASFVAGGVRAVICPADGSTWYIQPRGEVSADARPGEHVVYPASAIGDSGHSCGGAIALPDAWAGAAPAGGFGGRSFCLREADLGLDLDYTYYTHHGSTTAGALADAESIVNGVNVIYNRDALVQFKIGTAFVRTDSSLYNSSDIGTLLGMLQSQWTGPHAAVVRDVAHLFTGQPTGGVIGLAWVNVVCNFGYQYAVSNVDFTGDYGAKVGLVCHEIGHNFAAGHCDGAPDCSIMCSGIGGCAGNLAAFSETSVGPIRGAAASNCLTITGPASAPGGPGAIANSYTLSSGSPVRLDVMGNDRDPNCDPISIASFDGTTYAGGTVALSPGTGPNGRDELLYTPRAGAIGYDTFLYTISDPGGAQSTARVYISNQTPRAADSVGQVEPGLVASYYRAGGGSALPDFGTLTPYKTSTVANLNYPRTFSNIAASGRNSNIAAVFTGTIDIPADDLWTFYTSSEDGSMLFIDGQRIVSNDFVHASMVEASGQAALSAGPHEFRVEFFSGYSTNGGLIASWKPSAGAKQVIPASALAPGLTAVYSGLPPALSQLPEFTGRTPYLTSVVAELNQPSTGGDFMDSQRADEVLAAFDGYFVAPSDGAYTFFCESDDGSRLFIGDSTVVNNDGLHGMYEVGSAVTLLAGHHRLRIEFFENGGGAGLIARVQGPGIAKQVIPASMLVHDSACPSDYNEDGFVTGEDFDGFVEAFVAGEASSDFNGDGFVNGEDFDEFAAAFVSGC